MNNTNIPPCYYRISVKALIHNDEGKILLTKEDNGFYEFPGGGLDYGEDPHTGLRREILEEMGLICKEISQYPSYFFTFTNRKGDASCANVFYDVSLENFNFTPSSECVEIGFFSPEEISNINVMPNVIEFTKIYNPENHTI